MGDKNPDIFNVFNEEEINKLERFSDLEKLAAIYGRIFVHAKSEQVNVNDLFLKLCENFGIFAVLQKVDFVGNDDECVNDDALLIFVDDEKYAYHSVCLSLPLLDDMISEGKISFNSFLIPLKFIDSMKVSHNNQYFRVLPTENVGLFFSNNEKNNDIQGFSKLTNIDSKMIIEMKNQAFINDENLVKIINKISQVLGLRVEDVFEEHNKTKELFFASQKGTIYDNLSLAKKANSLVGMQIVKDNQNGTFDCASFVSYLFMAELGIDIQENGFGNSTTGKIMSSSIGKNYLISEEKSIQEKCEFIMQNAEVGDVMLFHRQSAKSNSVEEDNWFPGHVGIYIGDGKYVDARHRRGDVSVVDINDDEYMRCFIGFKRFIFERSFEEQPFENENQKL